MMKKATVVSIAVVLLAVGFRGHVSAQGHDVLARFEGGIGVDPVVSFAAPANADGTFQNVVRNFVRGVRPGTTPWRITDLKAQIDLDGRIRVKGRGLLQAGGDSIGRTSNQSVFATLICEATGPFVERNSASSVDGTHFDGAVPLDPNGDFQIDDTLKLVGDAGDPVPAECASPVLLIRNAAGAWFAAGIPTVDQD